MQKKGIIIGILLFFFGLFAGRFGGRQALFLPIQEKAWIQNNFSPSRIYPRLEEISRYLSQDYFDQDQLIEKNGNMINSAVKAYIDGLEDPYTSYLDHQELADLHEGLEGEGHIEGIGVVIGKKDYYIQIEEVIKGSAAFKEGLQPLDRIVLIGTGETKAMTPSEAAREIRGEAGTLVQLLIERVSKEGKKSYLEKEVVREKIDIPSVKSKIIEQEGIKAAQIELFVFWDQTNKLLTREISRLLDEHVKGIILDLRGNWGGLLESAIDIAGHFLPAQSIVVKSQDIQGERAYESKGFGELARYPLVILIDQLSASSSEILALALKENLWAQIVGKKSFGKGSIQTLQDLSDGSSLKYTVGERYGPKGTSINKEGIAPDVEVEIDIEKYLEDNIDDQLEEAKKLLFQIITEKNT